MTNKKPFLILGTGGHAQMCWGMWCAMAEAGDPLTDQYEMTGWIDQPDKVSTEPFLGYPVYGETEEILDQWLQKGVTTLIYGLAMLSSKPSRSVHIKSLEDKGFSFLSVIHPTAYVDATAEIGPNITIGPMAFVHTYAKVGRDCVISGGAMVEHHTVVGENSHISSNTTLCGFINVGRDCMIGAGSTVIQGMTIPNGTMVGAGSVVVKPPTKPLVKGVPAK